MIKPEELCCSTTSRISRAGPSAVASVKTLRKCEDDLRLQNVMVNVIVVISLPRRV